MRAAWHWSTTSVISSTRLPTQERIDNLLGVFVIDQVLAAQDGIRLLQLVLCLVRSDARCACNALTQTDFQVVEPVVGSFHERLVADAPTQRVGGEGIPLVVFGQNRRTIMTHGGRCQVATFVRVVQTIDVSQGLLHGVLRLDPVIGAGTEIVPQIGSRRRPRWHDVSVP